MQKYRVVSHRHQEVLDRLFNLHVKPLKSEKFGIGSIGILQQKIIRATLGSRKFKEHPTPENLRRVYCAVIRKNKGWAKRISELIREKKLDSVDATYSWMLNSGKI